MPKLKSFDGTPGALAFLVCESRARRSGLSGDRFSDYWIPDPLRSSVQRIYSDYIKDVYRDDDKVMAARNQYFQSLIHSIETFGSVVLAPSGLGSYPYTCQKRLSFTEIDLPDVIEFKRERAEQLSSIACIPHRDVQYIPLDLTTVDWESDLDAWFVGDHQRCVILEGISYYLSKSDWWNLIDVIFARLRPGDVLAFDFWPKVRSENFVYRKFYKFCRRYANFDEYDFNFIDEDELKSRFSRITESRLNITDVADYYSNELGGRPMDKNSILLDTMITVEKTK